MKNINEQINEVLRLAGVNDKYILEEGLKDKAKQAAVVLACIGATAVGLASTPKEALADCRVLSVEENATEKQIPNSFDIEHFRNFEQTKIPTNSNQNNSQDSYDSNSKQYTMMCSENGHNFKVIVTDNNSYQQYGYNTQEVDWRKIQVVLDNGTSKVLTPNNAPKVFNYLDKKKVLDTFITSIEYNFTDSSTNNGEVYTSQSVEKNTNYNDPKVVDKISNDVNNAINQYNKQ
jgi:hypothetical protein